MNTNTRKLKLSWKTDKDTGVKRPSVECDVPVIQADMLHAQALQPHLIGFLESVQDKMVRESIEAGKPMIQAVGTLDLEHMIEFLDAETTSARLTKDKVCSWFDEELADILRVAIADVLGVSDTPTDKQVEIIELSVRGHKDKIAALAGGKTSYAPKVAAKLQKALELLDSSDPIVSRFVPRLEKMQVEESAEMLGL